MARKFFKACREEAKRYDEMKKQAQAEILEEFKARGVDRFEKAKQVITIRETANTKAVREQFPEIWEQVKTESISEYIRA